MEYEWLISILCYIYNNSIANQNTRLNIYWCLDHRE